MELQLLDDIRELINDLEVEYTARNRNDLKIYELWLHLMDKQHDLRKLSGFYEDTPF